MQKQAMVIAVLQCWKINEKVRSLMQTKAMVIAWHCWKIKKMFAAWCKQKMVIALLNVGKIRKFSHIDANKTPMLKKEES